MKNITIDYFTLELYTLDRIEKHLRAQLFYYAPITLNILLGKYIENNGAHTNTLSLIRFFWVIRVIHLDLK